jgi:5-oxopent-3-ene-1,2,5-tricarboxylate decarboxylase / 2-hydroxyhepta-2,4-diene-1,7-dioate isomerase
VKLFNYFTDKQEPRIGIELQRKHYNFTQIWEFFKDIKGFHQSPQLFFLQMMIELDFFNEADINEVISTVSDFRTMEDLRIDDDITSDFPIARPQKILCIGRNYRKHAAEMGNDAPSEPIFFAKMPSSMLAHKGIIQLPADVGRVDHEIELAVVIGKIAKYVSIEQANEVIAGYTIVNDVTARAMQKGDIEKKQPWLRSKSFDTFCPIGPYLVPRDVVHDPQNLNLTLRVNGEIRQESNTSHMIFPVTELISYISRHMTLLPGDIIATGTPDGISPLQSGDVVTCEIESIGILENFVR